MASPSWRLADSVLLDPYDVPISPHRTRKVVIGAAADNDDSIKPDNDDSLDVQDGADDGPSPATTSEPKIDANGDGTDAKSTTDDADDDDNNNSNNNNNNNNDDDKTEAEAATDNDSSGGKAPMPPQAVLQDMEINELTAHRVNKDVATVEFEVHWANGEKTWEPEWELQTQVPELIFDYWDAHKGREHATGLDVYHAFRLLKRAVSAEGKPSKYLVQWVGYRRADATWEPEKKLRQIAAGELSRYEHDHGPASESAIRKRGVTRGAGRPRKKVRRSNDSDE